MDPALDILQRVVAVMKADAAVSALVGSKVFDRPPHKDGEPDVPSPYISLGPHDTTTDETGDCFDVVSISFQVDVWSWGNGEAYSRAEAGHIASAVRKALHTKYVNLVSGDEVEVLHRQTRMLRDPDGTNHAAMTFEALVDVT
ncbi:DUF3168 domain-containing protein [Shinella zoogloeoides]|uniref:DUF3168 domain-containing protein n=1 Tax=Shinella zoogloeoides TaxID=352475 RepID=UPI001F570DB9|nr:DUF3168 domain-containing protein [Shinella zoogloeoides]